MWSPWKCEISDDIDGLGVDAGGLEIGVELAGRALAALEVRLAGAGVDDDELRAGIHRDRRIRNRDLVLFQVHAAGERRR